MSDWLALLGAVGLTIILTESKATARVRRLWPALLNCSMCSGFWVGLATGALQAAARSRFGGWQAAAFSVLFGGATSVSSYGAVTLLDALERANQGSAAPDASEPDPTEQPAAPHERPPGTDRA